MQGRAVLNSSCHYDPTKKDPQSKDILSAPSHEYRIMCSARLKIPDCKVEVRSYVLVQNPSRWKMKGERVIVHSPVRNLSTTPQEIPVKRYCQDEEGNSVCMLGAPDIERDTSNIYEELQVSRVRLLFSSIPKTRGAGSYISS